MFSTYEKMTGGALYCCNDEGLARLQTECLEKLYELQRHPTLAA